MPKVSICMPTYKRVDLVRAALKSVEEQTYRDFELIITDDTPDDSIGTLIAEFKNIPGLRYVKNKVRQGSPQNFNRAMELATGEYIKILCSDDRFADAGSLAEFMKAFEEHPDAELAFCLSKNVDFATKKAHVNPVPAGFLRRLRRDYRNIFPRNFMGSPSAVIFRRSPRGFMDPKVKFVVDFVMYADVLRENPKFVFIDKPLVEVTTDDPGQITSQIQVDKELKLFEWFYAYRRIYGEFVWRFQPVMFFYYLAKRYQVGSVDEIPEFDSLPKQARSLIAFFIRVPDFLNIASRYRNSI